MSDEQEPQDPGTCSPMGSVAILWAWLAFRIKLGPEAVERHAGVVYEMLGAVERRHRIAFPEIWEDEDVG